MRPTTQLEDIKTIAEFMGYEYHNDYPILFPEGYYQLDELIANKYLVQQFKYHSSWDALMPVWGKFRNMVFEKITYEKMVVLREDIGYLILTEETPLKAFEAIANGIKLTK